MTVQPGLSDLVRNPEDRFSHNEAPIIKEKHKKHLISKQCVLDDNYSKVYLLTSPIKPTFVVGAHYLRLIQVILNRTNNIHLNITNNNLWSCQTKITFKKSSNMHNRL